MTDLQELEEIKAPGPARPADGVLTLAEIADGDAELDLDEADREELHTLHREPGDRAGRGDRPGGPRRAGRERAPDKRGRRKAKKSRDRPAART